MTERLRTALRIQLLLRPAEAELRADLPSELAYNPLAMTNIWNRVVSGSAGFVGGLVGGTFKWFFPSRKDWSENRKAKSDQKIDSKVLGTISNYKLWTGARPMTGAGIPVV